MVPSAPAVRHHWDEANLEINTFRCLCYYHQMKAHTLAGCWFVGRECNKDFFDVLFIGEKDDRLY